MNRAVRQATIASPASREQSNRAPPIYPRLMGLLLMMASAMVSLAFLGLVAFLLHARL